MAGKFKKCMMLCCTRKSVVILCFIMLNMMIIWVLSISLYIKGFWFLHTNCEKCVYWRKVICWCSLTYFKWAYCPFWFCKAFFFFSFFFVLFGFIQFLLLWSIFLAFIWKRRKNKTWNYLNSINTFNYHLLKR